MIFIAGKYKPRTKPTIRRPKPKSKYLLKAEKCTGQKSDNITDGEGEHAVRQQEDMEGLNGQTSKKGT